MQHSELQLHAAIIIIDTTRITICKYMNNIITKANLDHYARAALAAYHRILLHSRVANPPLEKGWTTLSLRSKSRRIPEYIDIPRLARSRSSRDFRPSYLARARARVIYRPLKPADLSNLI